MDFKTRPIQKNTSNDVKSSEATHSDEKKGVWSFLAAYFSRGYLLFLFFLLVTASGLALALKIAEEGTQKGFVRPEIFKTAPKITNVLLLGVAGAGEDGGYLTDSIILASLHHKTAEVRLLSIPRDTWVNTKSSIGERKINSVYATARSQYGKKRALQITKTAVADFTGQPVDFAAVLDFSLFEEAIDVLGGVEVLVEKPINDPFYPAANYQYQRFALSAGRQVLNGATALKYARSRQTTSDFDRSRRQQKLLMALKEEALKQGLLYDFERLREYYTLYQKKVNTDLGIADIISLAKVGATIDASSLKHAVLSDDFTTAGGLLTTGAKQVYGQFVLIPRSPAQMDLFLALFFEPESPLGEGARIEIINATKTEGLARQAKQFLTPLGFDVVNIDNAEDDLVHSGNFVQLLTKKDTLHTLDFLRNFYEAKEKSYSPQPGEDIIADVRLSLGLDEKTKPEALKNKKRHK